MTRRKKWKITIASGVLLICAAGPVAADEYRLGVSDRVKIRVQEWPDLGGEYTVATNGLVSLPLVGNIDAAGLRVGDVAQEISDRLQQRSEGAERPFAAVEIVQFRPFSILGDVQRPGAYPYRPGLTVLHAVSIAGGFYRPELGLLRLGRDVAMASGEIRTLMLKQTRLIAREARLMSALAGRGEIALPGEFTNQKDDPAISAIMESERAALTLENDIVRSERASLDEIKALYQREIGSLRGQIQALTQEESTIQQQVKEFRSLSSRGLALMPTLFTLERSLAQIANEKMSMETAIVKAEENIRLAEQRLLERDLARSRANTRELQQTKDEIAEGRARLRTEKDLLAEAQISAPAEARARLVEHGRRAGFTLVRRDGDALREIAADETTPVLPEDIIKIPMIARWPDMRSDHTDVSRAEGLDKPAR